TLMLSKMRFPDVDEEDRPAFAALVPRLVLDRIVEGESLADAPGTCLAAHSELAAHTHHQRQMHHASNVRHPVVRRNVRACLENREEDVRRLAVDAAN